MERSMFYITAEDMEEAKKLAKILVEERLAACVNVVPKIVSFFYWDGETQSEEETLIIGKTRTVLVDKLVETVKQHHSYDVPCIVTWKLDKGNPEFLNWINEETS